jgi:predicted component of type VI protein secretion system
MFKSLRFGPLVPMFALLVLALVAGALTGCATLSAPQNQAVEQITVQYATGKFIEAKPTGPERAARAAQVKAVALSVKSVAASDSATIASLSELALSKVATANLQPSDRLLAQSLVTAVVNELSARVAGGVLTPENRVVVTQMLDWVIAAADAYAPGA